MHRLTYQGAVYECRDGETVIEAFLRQGVNIPFSCRNGICQVCLHRSVHGAPPPMAQKGLRPTLQERGYFIIPPNIDVYEGMIVGANSRENDIVVNVCTKKQLTNIRAAGKDEALVLGSEHEI